ncbi:MAG: D-glycero-beta-D-manno-heptose 1,7-bisphosphate 7-phosphatase [Candidatus Hodarchaeales archaeon]|jgi:D-glycero-D-manno-heptose 1,7-bisphosphate phosphatase
MAVKQAVILAGGLGTRLRPLTDSLPKPMVSVNNRPFLEYLIEMLKENEIEEVVLLLGYLAEKIIDHFGDGSKFGIKIKYSVGAISFETGTRLRNAKPLLEDLFLLMYCDNYWPLDLKKLIDFRNKDEVLSTVTVYTNKDNFTRNNMLVDEGTFVIKYDRSRTDKSLNGVDIGYFLMNKKVLDFMPNSNFSLSQVITPMLVEKNQLRGYLTDYRYYSISTPDRIPLTEQFLQQKKVIFLDRDGVINKKAPKADYVKKWEEFEFLPGSIEAISLLAESGYKIFVITNQAGIARGMMSEKDLATIHGNMKNELNKHNIQIAGIYYCPHGWNDGCDCRKPKPGMFYQAAREHHINPNVALFIGDDERDVQAGEAAGVKTILITAENNLLKVVNHLLEGNEK